MPRDSSGRGVLIKARPDAFSTTLGSTLAYALIALIMSPKAELRTSAYGDKECVPDGRTDAQVTSSPASSPESLPTTRWLDILKAVWENIDRNRVVAVAAGLTFYALLAIFPGITAVVSIYGLFANSSIISDQMSQFAGIIPDGAISVINDQVRLIAAQPDHTLGFAFLTGLLISLWSANAGIKALFDALNVAYGVAETRSFIILNVVSLTFTAALVLLALAGIAAAVVIPLMLERLPHFSGIVVAIRWLLLLAYVVIGLSVLALLYRYGPARERPAGRWITPGSAVAAIVWLIASASFAYYTANFGSYNQTYGTLGAVVGLMTWMWVSAIVVMIGAEINAKAERAGRFGARKST